jgi:hypothetical protein
VRLNRASWLPPSPSVFPAEYILFSTEWMCLLITILRKW